MKLSKKIIIPCVIVIVIAILLLIVVTGQSDSDESKTTNTSITTSETRTSENDSLQLKFGELVSVTGSDEETVVVKAKIEPSYNNKTTIDQNYYNIETLINENGFDKYTEIQYWAVADMNSGEESKVISFTVNKDLIDKIKNKQVVANELGDYVDELWIHQSLR